MAQEYDDTNQGALFTNEDKTDEHPNWPDYQGTLDVDGVKYFLSAWIKTAKQGKMQGKTFMSVSVKKKDKQPGTQPEAQRQQGSGSERPF